MRIRDRICTPHSCRKCFRPKWFLLLSYDAKVETGTAIAMSHDELKIAKYGKRQQLRVYNLRDNIKKCREANDNSANLVASLSLV